NGAMSFSIRSRISLLGMTFSLSAVYASGRRRRLKTGAWKISPPMSFSTVSAPPELVAVRSARTDRLQLDLRSQQLPAKCWGVGSGRGEARLGGWCHPVGWAHSEQDFAVAESWAPQWLQARASGAAHSSQNLAPGRFSCRQREHCMPSLPAGLATGGRDGGL